MDATVTSIIIQVVAGIVLTYVIYVISLFTIRSDKFATQELASIDGKQKVTVFDGTLTSSETAMKSSNNNYNTTIPFLHNYLPITPSSNAKGGSQFSYAFWLYVGKPQRALNKAIFLKGDKKPYTYKIEQHSYNHLTNNTTTSTIDTRNEKAIVCPMFSMGGENMEFELTFNTMHNIKEKMVIRRIQSEDSLKRHNMHGLFPKSWFHITIVFEDNVSINDFQKGLLVRFYLNNSMYQMETYNTTLKQNRGNLSVFPDGSIEDLKIADFTYYNYAITEKEIGQRVAQKPDPMKSASSSKENIRYGFETGPRNEFDEYNI